MVKSLQYEIFRESRWLHVKAFSHHDLLEYIQQQHNVDMTFVYASRACTPDERYLIEETCVNSDILMYVGIANAEYVRIRVDSLEQLNAHIENRDPDEVTTVYVSKSTPLLEVQSIKDAITADEATLVWGGLY